MVSFLLKLQKCSSDVAFRLSDSMCVDDLSAGYKLNQLLRQGVISTFGANPACKHRQSRF